MRFCDQPDCLAEGPYPAPRSREDLRQYYWFCLDHVRAYNRAWNFYAGMSEAEVEARTDIAVDDNPDRKVALINENVTLSDLVSGLNALGVSPREMIDILKSIKSAGALHAELVVQ